MKNLLQEVKGLKSKYKYKEARDLIEKEKIEDSNLLRELAECYYKDLELHRDFSYKEALDILKNIKKDSFPEKTLQLQGAVYKRKWEYQANLDDLYKTIEHYEKAYNEHKIKDEGYGGINAAYMYDILANKVSQSDKEYSQILHKKAIDIRKDIIDIFSTKKDDQWIYHTLAQAYLGIGEVSTCKGILEESSKKFKYADWETFTTYKQLKFLAELKGIIDLDFLFPLIGQESEHLLHLSLDKKGLALSGGGFRASFFHLGTLAKLAECNLLKDIEVISTVSGGSIVGVHYYLKLQELLEENEDLAIEQKHYIKLVEELIEEFFEAVQTNIRNGVLWSSPLKTLRYMIPCSGYSRTNRLGELYQERIYKKYKKYMRELIITPKEWEDRKEKFKPRFNNWRRKNKVPILVINATNLNSGHNWQFQATKMGEPDYMYNMEIDKNDRFSWVRYTNKGLLNKFKNYSIGQAVASSSAVPVLFTPIILNNLYDGYELSISDGGVYDNQGFSGLLSEECDYIICSDASGQMDDNKTSAITIPSVNIRTSDIQMDRNRELVFEDIERREEKGSIKGFKFTHLKKDIKASTIKQENVIQEFEDNDDKKFQKLISSIRTDLDRFSKIEAYALMYNGYDLFEKEIDKSCKQIDWVFLSIKKDIENESKKLIDELELSKYKVGKKFSKWWRNYMSQFKIFTKENNE